MRIQVALWERENHPASGAAVNYPTSRAAAMTSCSLYLSEEISLVPRVFSFICWDPDIALKKWWHLEQIWSWYSLISSPIVQASALPAGGSLAFEQAWNPDALKTKALRIWLTVDSSKKTPWLCLYKKRCPLLGLAAVRASGSSPVLFCHPFITTASPLLLLPRGSVCSNILHCQYPEKNVQAVSSPKHGQRSEEDAKGDGSTSG